MRFRLDCVVPEAKVQRSEKEELAWRPHNLHHCSQSSTLSDEEPVLKAKEVDLDQIVLLEDASAVVDSHLV